MFYNNLIAEPSLGVLVSNTFVLFLSNTFGRDVTGGNKKNQIYRRFFLAWEREWENEKLHASAAK
jgi:hypothetical protein